MWLTQWQAGSVGAKPDHYFALGSHVKHSWAWSPEWWWDAWALCLPQDFSGVKFCADSTKVLWTGTHTWKDQIMMHAKDPTVWQSVSGSWKYPNNPACFVSVRLQNIQVGQEAGKRSLNHGWVVGVPQQGRGLEMQSYTHAYTHTRTHTHTLIYFDSVLGSLFQGEHWWPSALQRPLFMWVWTLPSVLS